MSEKVSGNRLDALIKLINKLESVNDGTHSISKDQCYDLLQAFCRVKPPKTPKAEHTVEFIILSSGGRRGGVSVKPGNITLNWSKLLGALPGIVLTGAGATANGWFIFLGALVIWKDLYATSKVKLDPPHAIAMLTMWENHDGSRRISEDKARRMTNKALANLNMNELSEGTFAQVVDDLCEIGCITLSEGEIWLREWIRRNWP
ncbi:hypothetical protein EOI86_16165 [Hwanghaeella grinnelliae]|uniref:Uncharacterized protein n=1 Tax=Hwanghaeella grinnelliae TaxID=2500179 RepID=A0A437QQJ1_9PROT|nr:hypothetical protein [Hwanghaeella grinnelliae]RVU36707.1 hypothetical protein EOI86_16165 [Hwanghaeella grinnelliae]